jgi:glycine betaine/proline transport system substrate-binding protein
MQKNKKNYVPIIIFLLIIGAVVIWLISSGEQQQVPQQNDISKSAFAEEVDFTITGIDPGAGIMINTEKAMDKYGLKDAGWQLSASSSAAMMSALQDSVENNEPIIATVWEPHSAFAIADLRKLEDPENVYNDPQATKEFLKEFAAEYSDAEVSSDVIATVVYQDFKNDAPAAYKFFQNFNVSSDTQSNWIYQLNVQDKDPEVIADEYVNEKQDLIEKWLPSEEIDLGKDAITIGIPPWPGATVKSRVVAAILEEIGYQTEVKEMDSGVVYTSLADKQIDVSVAGWLPTTHQSYWEEKGDQLEIAGINITQTWLGLAVPQYVDENIKSIEDLK